MKTPKTASLFSDVYMLWMKVSTMKSDLQIRDVLGKDWILTNVLSGGKVTHPRLKNRKGIWQTPSIFSAWSNNLDTLNIHPEDGEMPRFSITNRWLRLMHWREIIESLAFDLVQISIRCLSSRNINWTAIRVANIAESRAVQVSPTSPIPMNSQGRNQRQFSILLEGLRSYKDCSDSRRYSPRARTSRQLVNFPYRSFYIWSFGIQISTVSTCHLIISWLLIVLSGTP